MGRLVTLTEPISLSLVVDMVKAHLKLKHVRVASRSSEQPISKVAICAGSGASLLKNVKADLYLTGEMSHHEVLDAVHKGANVILSEHSNSERGFLHQWIKTLRNTFGNQVQIDISSSDRDPLEVV